MERIKEKGKRNRNGHFGLDQTAAPASGPAVSYARGPSCPAGPKQLTAQLASPTRSAQHYTAGPALLFYSAAHFLLPGPLPPAAQPKWLGKPVQSPPRPIRPVRPLHPWNPRSQELHSQPPPPESQERTHHAPARAPPTPRRPRRPMARLPMIPAVHPRTLALAPGYKYPSRRRPSPQFPPSRRHSSLPPARCAAPQAVDRAAPAASRHSDAVRRPMLPAPPFLASLRRAASSHAAARAAMASPPSRPRRQVTAPSASSLATTASRFCSTGVTPSS